MGNLSVGLKKFLSNKNTVTIVGIFAAVLLIYISYNMKVNNAITPIRVPYAKKTISPGTQITKEYIGYKNVSAETISDGNAYISENEVIDKFVSPDGIIPEGSLFYKRAVIKEEQMPDAMIRDYPSGYVLYNLSVNNESTYGNSIYPGNYIDIYLKAINAIAEGEKITTTDKIMVGKLLSNVKVLAVLDSSGNNVFANLDAKGTPAMIVFAVPEEYFILLKKAGYLRAYDTTIIPVPTDESLKDDPGELKLSSEDLKDFINRVTVFTEE